MKHRCDECEVGKAQRIMEEETTIIKGQGKPFRGL